MCKPHKHAVAIKAWADGKSIEQRVANGEWVDVLCPYPSWHLDWEYRIKPKVIKYKRFLLAPSPFAKDQSARLEIVTIEVQQREPRDKWTSFVRWIDNDWIEQEV